MICSQTLPARSAICSIRAAAAQLRPGAAPARPLGAGPPARRRASRTERPASSPASPVNRSAVGLPWPVRAANVRLSRRSRPATARERSRTRGRVRSGQLAGLRGLARQHPGRVLGQPEIGRIADVGLDDRRVDPRRPRDEAPLGRPSVARAITASVISSTTSGPSRRTSLRTVDSSGTRSLSAIRQNRRRCNESETSRTSVS